jgi:hypothetical protein
MSFVIFGGGKQTISTVDEWRLHGAPKGGDRQWVDGRSAKELAKARCSGGEIVVPLDMARLLASHPSLHALELRSGYAEHKTRLRGERRGPRVHDLLLAGETPRGRVVIGVEAKADETFDATLGERWATAQATLERGEPTNWPVRLRRLCLALLGVDAVSPAGTLEDAVATVPYQLLSALAGTLIEADERNAELAVLAVHVFATDRTRPEIVATNKQVFASFVERVTSVPAAEVEDGRLYGPFDVPGGGGIPQIPTLIGVVTTRAAHLPPG